MSPRPESKLLIFGLPRDATVDEVHSLLGSCGGTLAGVCAKVPLEVLDVPGRNDESFAVVHLWPDPLLATRLVDKLNARRLRGRGLWCWVPAMAW